MAIDNAGEALSGRQALETTYLRATRPEVEKFLKRVRQRALAGTLTGVYVLANWVEVVERVAEVSPGAAEFLRESEVPAQALTAALTAVSAANALSYSKTRAEKYVSTALGLEKVPVRGLGGEFGRIIDPTESLAVNWVGSAESAARTASTADFGASMLQQLRDEGYTHKQWMTRYDSRVRPTHAEVDRHLIPLEEDFIVGGAALRFPADPKAAAPSEVIGCRCVLFGVNPTRRPWDFPEGEEPWNAPYPGAS